MATDSKLGLVIGIGIVVAVAVVYFPKAIQRDRTNSVVPSLPAATRPIETQTAMTPSAEGR